MEKVGNNEKIAQELEFFFFRQEPDEKIKSKPRRELMRDAIAEMIKEYSIHGQEKEQRKEEIEEFRRTRPRVVITTNYDTFLDEEIFAGHCRRYIGPSAVLCEEDKDKTGEDITDIYKIHGCVNAPDSIVITKEDYDEFFEKSKYMYAKILTLFYEYPLIFMGYSISDRNIKDVLTTMVEMMSAEQIDEFSRRIWILERSEETGQDEAAEREIELLNGKSLKVKCFYLYDYREFFYMINSVTNSQRFGELKFTVSDDVIELLIKPLYEQQDNLKVVTRELLQNALDACKNIGVNADIVISIYKNGEDFFLEVRDNGIGMNVEDIRSKLLTVGKSGKRDESRGMVGKYGIGILSVFLVGEYAEVYTKKGNVDLLSFQLHLNGDKKQVSWINEDIEERIREYFDCQAAGTLIRVKVKEKSKIENIKKQEELLAALGLEGYLTKGDNTIKAVNQGQTYVINKLEEGDYFYPVNEDIHIYRSEWLDADKRKKINPVIKAIYEQCDMVFFNDMLSKAVYNFGTLTFMKGGKVPFVVLNIDDLNRKESEFKTMLSRNNVEVGGTIAKDIATGIYTMEIEKLSDLIQSKYDAIKSGDYSVKKLRELLMNESSLFGRNADILIQNNRLFATVTPYLPHLEIWGYCEWASGIIRNIDEEIVLYKNMYMHKSSIADMIENGRVIAISVNYLDEYLYRATSPNNGLRAGALKNLLRFLEITEIESASSATDLWSYIGQHKEEIRDRYTKKSNKGMLWFEENYRKEDEEENSYEYKNENVIIFESYFVSKPIDVEFAALLKKKLEEKALGDILGTK